MHRLLVLFLLFLTSCSNLLFMKEDKQRIENGNNLKFFYFKTVPYSNYIFRESLSVSDTYNTIIQFFGAQPEITNEQYWTFLNTIRKDSEEEFFKPII